MGYSYYHGHAQNALPRAHTHKMPYTHTFLVNRALAGLARAAEIRPEGVTASGRALTKEHGRAGARRAFCVCGQEGILCAVEEGIL